MLCCIIYFLKPFFIQKNISDKKTVTSSVISSDSFNKAKYVETPVNFVELKKANKEIYAWINIPGTIIDYPILQSDSDNTYYLSHTVNGKKSVYGSIYTENYNTKTFSDFNTVIYGHNMLNGTMFASLRKFKDYNFFKTNNIINIYLPGRILKYEVFAAYIFDDRHIMLSYDFSDENICKAYLDSIFDIRKMNSNINTERAVTVKDKILTLSTCTNKSNERFLVQGVLIYDSNQEQ